MAFEFDKGRNATIVMLPPFAMFIQMHWTFVNAKGGFLKSHPVILLYPTQSGIMTC